MRGGGTKYRREARKGIEADTNGHARRVREVAEKIKDIAKLYQMLATKCARRRNEVPPLKNVQNNLIWPHGQAVKTSPFHGGNGSSILPGVTKTEA